MAGGPARTAWAPACARLCCFAAAVIPPRTAYPPSPFHLTICPIRPAFRRHPTGHSLSAALSRVSSRRPIPRFAEGGSADEGAEAKMIVSSSLAAPEGYRANVGICLVNKENKVFVAARIDKPGAWQMPQGGIDHGEDPATAARRELKEETGVTSAELLTEVPEWLCYDFPPAVRAKLTVAWGKEWQGQAQRWFLFRFTGVDESEITLLGDGSERPEFNEWKWMDVPGVINAVVNFKKPVYEAAFRFFKPHLK